MGRETDRPLAMLADCSKARSVNIHDRCQAVYKGL
jgi:hypothetical protein